MSLQYHCGKWQAQIGKKCYCSRRSHSPIRPTLKHGNIGCLWSSSGGLTPGGARLSGSCGADIANFVKEPVAEGVSGKTVRLDIGVISRVYNRARAEWGVETLVNPSTHVRLPAYAKRNRRLTAEEEASLLALRAPSCGHASCGRWRPPCGERKLRRWTGRTSTWRDVRPFCRRPRRASKLTVPLSPKALDILYALAPQKAGSVFGMSAAAITQAMNAACKNRHQGPALPRFAA